MTPIMPSCHGGFGTPGRTCPKPHQGEESTSKRVDKRQSAGFISLMTHSDKDRAMRLLAQGLITTSEAAELVGRSRQAVHVWTKRAGIDPIKRRQVRVRQLWR